MLGANREKFTKKKAYKPSVQLRTREGRDVPLGLSSAGIQQQLLKTSSQQLAGGLVKGRRGRWVLRSHIRKLLTQEGTPGDVALVNYR